MKAKKRILAIALVLVLAVGIVPTALAASVDDVDPADAYAYNSITKVYYETLEEALSAAKRNETVYLLKDYTLAQSTKVGDYVTLVIPTSDSLNDTTTGKNVNGAVASGKAYATLTVPEKLTLTVQGGTLIVAGNQQGAVPTTGFRTGDYGAINLLGNIEVTDYGVLYARGEISGAGTVTVADTCEVYERFEISDWRGGNASKNAFDQDIFPFNLYGLGGIDSKLVVETGAFVYGQSFIYAESLHFGANINVPFISTIDTESGEYDVSGSVITFKNGDTDGSLTFTKNGTRTTITIDKAEIETGNISYSVKVFGVTLYDFSSAKTDCPFGYKTDVVLNNSTVDMRTKIKFLPGCTFTVGTGSTLNITSDAAMYFYSEGVYQKAWCDYSGEWGYENAAVLNVTGGTVTNNGTLASSSATFDNLLGLGTITSGGDATVDEVTQSGTSVTVVHVPFYKAVLPTPAE